MVECRSIGIIFTALVLSGCAGIDSARHARTSAMADRMQDCAEWLRAVDREVVRSGATDAGGHRIPQFPYLRVNRFIASFGPEALRDPNLFNAWASAARDLDREGRAIELQNLPAQGIAALGAGNLENAISRTESCAAEQMHAEFATPSARSQAVANSRVPDDYDMWSRVLGVYPLTRIPFALGIEHWHNQAIDAFVEFSRGARPAAATVRYMPNPAEPLSRREVAALLSRHAVGPLGQFEPPADQLQRMFNTFAPVLEVETEGEFDRVGAVRLQEGARPSVDTSSMVVYRRLAHTRFHGEVLPQLVYTAWFPARPGSSPVDVLAGNLDGLVFRVTLGRDGAPLVYDAIHPCGCYHMFFPTAQLRPLPSPERGDEWAFVPAALPQLQEGQRVILHIQARTHYLAGITVAAAPASSIFSIEDEDQLRSLPVAGGERRSLYSPDGLVAGSERLERFLFWPSGVPSAGTMRQWGHHATAFLGVRHFDDPFLMQDRFEIPAQ